MIYGRGRTIETSIFFLKKKSAQLFAAETWLFLQKVTFLTHNTRVCMTTFTRKFSTISVRDVKDAAKVSPPKHCPEFYGLHFSPRTSTFHHHQPSNWNRVHFFDGPQNWAKSASFGVNASRAIPLLKGRGQPPRRKGQPREGRKGQTPKGRANAEKEGRATTLKY